MADVASMISETDKAEPQSRGLGVRLLAMIVATSLATAVCCFAVDFIGIIHPTPAAVLNLGADPTPEERAVAALAKFDADSGNAMVWFGAIGAILGGTIAFTMGCLRLSGVRILIGTIAGILLAGGLGCLAGFVSLSFHDSLKSTMIGSTSDSELQFMKMHALTWALICIGIGIACGLTHRAITFKSVGLSMIVACVAGCIAGASFPLLVAIAAPLADSSFPFPDPGAPRAVWIGLASIFTGLGLARSK